MPIIDINAAQHQLPDLLEAASRGEDVIIAKAGKPMVRLVPMTSSSGERRPGGMEGQIWMADDFDGPLPEKIQRAFEGR